MKRFMSVLAGMMLAVTLTLVNAGLSVAQTRDSDEKKAYRDEDPSRSKMDQDKSTVKKPEREQGHEGSAAGGVRDEGKGNKKSESSGEKQAEEPYPSISY